MTEIIKVIAENHQTVGRAFPGWRRKYPRLAEIPGLSVGTNAVASGINSDDLESLRRDLQRAGARLSDCRSLSPEQRELFQGALDKLEEDQAEARRRSLENENKKILKTLAAEWRELHKNLDPKAGELWRDFNPEQALKEELESGLQEVKTYLAKKDGLSRKWKNLRKKMDKQTKNFFKGFQYKSAGLDELEEKLRLAKETLEKKARETDKFLKDQKEALEERLEESENKLKEKLENF